MEKARDAMKTLGLVTAAALAIVLAAVQPSDAARHAERHAEHGVARGHVGERFEGHHHFDRDRHDWRVFVGLPFFVGAPSYYEPAYAPPPPPPAYWYYCPSYGAYYPYVGSCPEAWVPVPAS